jgi:hypothetical protein
MDHPGIWCACTLKALLIWEAGPVKRVCSDMCLRWASVMWVLGCSLIIIHATSFISDVRYAHSKKDSRGVM